MPIPILIAALDKMAGRADGVSRTADTAAGGYEHDVRVGLEQLEQVRENAGREMFRNASAEALNKLMSRARSFSDKTLMDMFTLLGQFEGCAKAMRDRGERPDPGAVEVCEAMRRIIKAIKS